MGKRLYQAKLESIIVIIIKDTEETCAKIATEIKKKRFRLEIMLNFYVLCNF